MSKLQSYLPTILKSLLIWVVPVIISSAGFYDAKGNLIGNYWVFKFTVIVALILTTYFAFRKFYKTHSNWLQTSGVIIAVNVILDLIVLVGLIKILPGIWATQILPFYLVCVPAVNYLLAKKYIK
jgi:hypothetical protein